VTGIERDWQNSNFCLGCILMFTIRNITIGYTFQRTLAKSYKKSARVYGSAQYVWSSRIGRIQNPELVCKIMVKENGVTVSPGVDLARISIHTHNHFWVSIIVLF